MPEHIGNSEPPHRLLVEPSAAAAPTGAAAHGPSRRFRPTRRPPSAIQLLRETHPPARGCPRRPTFRPTPAPLSHCHGLVGDDKVRPARYTPPGVSQAQRRVPVSPPLPSCGCASPTLLPRESGAETNHSASSFARPPLTALEGRSAGSGPRLDLRRTCIDR